MTPTSVSIFFLLMQLMILNSLLLCSCVKGSNNVTLIAVEVTYDPKSPKFGASTREGVCGLWIDWALEETGLCKDDR